MRCFVVVVFAALLALCQAEQARLVVAKDLSNNALVAKRDLVVKFEIHNIGDGPATDVTLTDDSFAKQSEFQTVAGTASAHWDRIPADTKVTHLLVLQPQFSGAYNFTAAKVTYFDQEDADLQKTATTSNPGSGQISDAEDYARSYDAHYMEWVLFLVLLVVPVAMPYHLWSSSASKYDKQK
eukprot:m.321741 g.321741  ORF g.321741 m.321741 type:complete len:182 (-) comp25808_c0_seq1:80-625(-)